ncbi:MAG: dihydroxy-acid dehydratase, partial [Planctomycetota bacterium]
PNRKLVLQVDDQQLERRRRGWTPRDPKINYGYLARYAAHVTSADTGAVLE